MSTDTGLILFDFYGVINKVDPYRVWLQSLGLKREGAFDEIAKKVDVGTISLEEFYAGLGRFTDKPAASVRQAFDDAVDIDQGVVQLLSQLKGKYKLGLISNAPSELIRHTLQQHDLEQYFDRLFISGEVGLRKPDHQFFEHALTEMQTAPTETLFVDDVQEYADAAQELGVTSIRFTTADQLAHELSKRGILWQNTDNPSVI